MMGYDFHTQKPLLNFIADFFCNELMLAIEIDGDSHEFKFENGITRQQQLEKTGIRFLRFDDLEVKKDMNNVLWSIEIWIKNNADAPKTHP